MKLKIIISICLVLFLFTLGSNKAYAISIDEIRESASNTMTQVWERVELVFAFSQGKKVEVLAKHAQRRLEWAETEFNAEDEEKGQTYLDEYVEIKGNIAGRLENVDEEILEEYKTKTIDENNQIDVMKNEVSDSVKNVIDKNQLEVLGATWEVVTDIQGTTEGKNFVDVVYSPGASAGGTSTLIIEGGELTYAPGTTAGGTSGVEIKYSPGNEGGGKGGVVIETDNSGGSGNNVVVD